MSTLAGLEDQEKVLARLLKNQKDIGNAIKPYYGEGAGNQLGDLLTEHIVVAGKVTAAAKAGNAADFEKYNKEWYRNADDIAVFLSKANPNWPMKTAQDLLFDQGEEHIIMLSDFLSDGIIKQFPKKFK